MSITIKNIVILENERIEDGNCIMMMVNRLQDKPNIIILDRLMYNREDNEILEAILKSDTIGVQTTFLYANQIVGFAKMFAKITKPKQIVFAYEHSKEKLLDILTPEQFYSVKHHNIYYTDGYGEIGLFDFSDVHKQYEIELEKQAEELLATKDKKTGIKIKVTNIQAFGKAFQGIKTGDILDVIDNSKNDPNPDRGIWVWGNGEPIKLLKCDGYNEYEFYSNEHYSNKTNTNGEIVKLSIEEQILLIANKDLNLLNIGKIKGCIELHNDDNTTNFGNLVCDILGIERRGNRTRINTLYNQHLNLVTI